MSNSRAASAMAATRPAGTGAPAPAAARKSFFEQQRELLLGEIAMSFEQVLANINKLNRSLEAVVTVGNEFSAVEALWSQFEGVMAKEPEPIASGEGADHDHDHEQRGEEGEERQEKDGMQEDNEGEEAATQLHDEEAEAATGGRRGRKGDIDFEY